MFKGLTLSQNSYGFSKMKEFLDDNFKFDENIRENVISAESCPDMCIDDVFISVEVGQWLQSFRFTVHPCH